MDRKNIKLELLDFNKGQIPGVASNPRKWSTADVKDLAASIEATPELLEVRGCIVYPLGGRYVVLGGNMRLRACQQMHRDAVPCIVLPEDTPTAKLRELVIKDNGIFGFWDWDSLANEWDEELLFAGHVIPWDHGDEDDPFKAEEPGEVNIGAISERMALRFKYTAVEMAQVKEALRGVAADEGQALRKVLKID